MGRADEGRAGWSFVWTSDLPGSHTGHLRGRRFRGSGAPPAHHAAQGQRTGHWPAPSSPATSSPSFTYRWRRGPWPGVPAAQCGGEGRALAGPGAQAAGKPRSRPEPAALRSGTAARRRPLLRAQGLTARGTNARGAAGAGRGQGWGLRRGGGRGEGRRGSAGPPAIGPPSRWERTSSSEPRREPCHAPTSRQGQGDHRESRRMGRGPGSGAPHFLRRKVAKSGFK